MGAYGGVCSAARCPLHLYVLRWHHTLLWATLLQYHGSAHGGVTRYQCHSYRDPWCIDYVQHDLDELAGALIFEWMAEQASALEE